MKKITLPSSCKLTSPNPVSAVISCGSSTGRDTDKSVFGDANEEALFAWNGYSEIAAALKK